MLHTFARNWMCTGYVLQGQGINRESVLSAALFNSTINPFRFQPLVSRQSGIDFQSDKWNTVENECRSHNKQQQTNASPRKCGKKLNRTVEKYINTNKSSVSFFFYKLVQM